MAMIFIVGTSPGHYTKCFDIEDIALFFEPQLAPQVSQ
jgi:hypothetical protein